MAYSQSMKELVNRADCIVYSDICSCLFHHYKPRIGMRCYYNLLQTLIDIMRSGISIGTG